MEPIVIAETERLIVRHFEVSDAAAMDRVYCDPEVMRYSRGLRTPEWVRERLQRCRHDYQEQGFGLFAVVEQETQSVVGYCGLACFPHFPGGPEIEIGYRLARAYWGRGYATEAARAVRDHAFESLRIPRLIALIDPQNAGSIHVAEKLGLRYERDVMLEGYSHPDRVYAIARPAEGPRKGHLRDNK